LTAERCGVHSYVLKSGYQGPAAFGLVEWDVVYEESLISS